ncbi:MAG: DUF2306 domain-containing protein [Gemmatimonadota bacterium]
MKQLQTFLLIALLVIGVAFLGAEWAYSATVDRAQFGLFENTVRFAHLIFTAPLLLLPIVQFNRRLRTARSGLHRRLGQLYLTSAIIAALGALYLGVVFEEPGRRPPLLLFAGLWLFFSVAAWVAAVRRDFRTHQHFVIRSYGVALAFVFVRVLGEFEPWLFGFLPEGEIRGVTREWIAFVLPLILIEAALNWWPAVRGSRSSRRA